MSNTAEQRDNVIKKMIASLNRGDQRHYFVGLVGYFIEGIPYSASGLSVDLDATPDIHVTDDGFSCTAFFPPGSLQPSTVKKKGIIKKEFGGKLTDLVRVRLDVRSDDIWRVAEFVDENQLDLFTDGETFVSRNVPFMAEMQKWFEQGQTDH